MMNMITPGQLRKVWTSAGEIGWNDAQLHAELVRVIGVKSLRDLTAENARLFIDFMISEGASPGRLAADPPRDRSERPDNVIELATPAQHAYVDRLLAAMAWTREEPYFLGALKKASGGTKIRTRREATLAIIFLEKMVAKRQQQTTESHSSPHNGVR